MLLVPVTFITLQAFSQITNITQTAYTENSFSSKKGMFSRVGK
jgi:hypothetical protein